MRIKTLFTCALIILGLIGLNALSDKASAHIDRAQSAIASISERAQ